MTTLSASERVALAVSDGTTMVAEVVRPNVARGATPGIIVFQDAYGVNDQLREIAGRLAGLGLTAIAPELYHRTQSGLVGAYDGRDDALRNRAKNDLTPAGTIADVRAAYDWLAREPSVATERIAAIGFCMGGRTVFVANAEVPLRAGISFYGGGIAPGQLARAPEQHGRLLMFWGGRDKHILAEHRRAVDDALTAAGKDHVQVTFAQAEHGFFGHQQPAYNADAARNAWALLVEFLHVAGVLTAAP
jgi:carboxymethylenebutenolidase